ncbi:Uncharacterised protein [Bacillus paranthracis]|nr:Uncharacterised protein [Bacillus paranthracis]
MVNHYYIINVLESIDEWTDRGIDSIEYLIKNGILPECITDLSGECRELLIYALDYQWSLEMDKK